MNKQYNNLDEIEAVVRGLESGTTPAVDFPHRSHLTVATWYLANATVAEALEKMRASILNFLDHYGIEGKYNETITRFWLVLVARCLQDIGPQHSAIECTNRVIEELGDSRLMFEYYSEELLWSEQAKNEWVEPDLKLLPKAPGV
jgi:hypothetical protein